MADAELRNMIMNFRVSDLVVLLSFAGRNKSGKKQELQSRALDLIKTKSVAVQRKIQELHNRRYHQQLSTRPSNYDIPERTHSDRPAHHYDAHLNNNYASRYNPNIRPPMNQNPNIGYSAGKPYMQPPPLQSSNVVPHFTSYVNVKFKELPFYDILYEIQKPSSLVNSVHDRYQEANFYFTLTSQQANDIAISRNASGNHDCQILLRFCLMETSGEQDDNFPPSICVKVNGKLVPLPNPIPTNRPGVEPKRPSRPVNITSLSKLAPAITNTITVSWSATYGRSYVFAIYVARQLTSSTLLRRLKSAGVRNAEYTTVLIKEQLQQGQDCDIAPTNLCGSLICPLGKIKMELPCRAVTCTHIQCFDAALYIQMNEKKPKWICPVCDKPALFRTLAIDGLFKEIAAQVPADCTEVQFNEDGSWVPIIPKKEPKEPPPKVVEKKEKCNKDKSVEIVDLSDNDSNDESSSNVSSRDETSDTVQISPPTEEITPFSYLSPHDMQSIATNMYATASDRLSPYPETLQAISSIQNEMSNPMCILPDTSIPSTSSVQPYNNYLDSYGGYHEPIGMGDNQSINSTYNNFDFFSLLEHVEPEDKSKETTPDIISLE